MPCPSTRISDFDLEKFWNLFWNEEHYENKLTKNIRPTDILQIYAAFWENLLNI